MSPLGVTKKVQLHIECTYKPYKHWFIGSEDKGMLNGTKRINDVAKVTSLHLVIHLLIMGNLSTLKKIEALEMRHYQRLLRIPFTDHWTNVIIMSVREEINIHKQVPLIVSVSRRKLQFFGHIVCSGCLSLTVLKRACLRKPEHMCKSISQISLKFCR